MSLSGNHVQVAPYVQARSVEQIVVEPDKALGRVQDEFLNKVQGFYKNLQRMGVLKVYDTSRVSAWQILEQRKLIPSIRGLRENERKRAEIDMSVASTFASAVQQMLQYGLQPFLDFMARSAAFASACIF